MQNIDILTNKNFCFNSECDFVQTNSANVNRNLTLGKCNSKIQKASSCVHVRSYIKFMQE